MANQQKQMSALAALAESDTFSEAAVKAGISRKTLYSYLRDDKKFARAYENMQNRLILEHMDAINEDREQARKIIVELMNDKEQPASLRLKAAQSIYTIADAQQAKAGQIAAQNINRDMFKEKYLD